MHCIFLDACAYKKSRNPTFVFLFSVFTSLHENLLFKNSNRGSLYQYQVIEIYEWRSKFESNLMTKHVEQLEDPPERVGREELGSVKSSGSTLD